MRVLIVEDEPIAAERLAGMINVSFPEMQICDSLDSVKSVVDWLSKNEKPDLLFLDIQLSDGLSFEIIEKSKVETPVIFTTAYDQFAIKAFKLNSVDYLLKPIVQEDLEAAIIKFKKQFASSSLEIPDSEQLMEILTRTTSRSFKERFVIKTGDHIKAISVHEAALFYSQDGMSYLHTESNKKYIVDYTLDQVETLMGDKDFFRINRKYIVHVDKIADIISFSNSRLKIVLRSLEHIDDLIVARDRVSEFKSWLDR